MKKKQILLYVSLFLLGVLSTLGCVYSLSLYNGDKQKEMFIKQAAKQYKKRDNHFDGDDYYRDYTGLELTDVDFNILAFILNNRYATDMYIYINKPSGHNKKWYIKRTDVYGERNDDDMVSKYEVFNPLTFTFSEISYKEFEKFEHETLQVYSSYGMD